LKKNIEIDVVPESKSALDATQNLPESLRDVADYIRTLEVVQPSVVHLWLDEVNIKGGLAAVATGVPRILLGTRSLPPIHFPLHLPYMREGYRWLARQPHVVMINNSEAGARAYEQWLKLPPNSIRVLHNGLDFEDASIINHRTNRTAYRERYGIPPEAPLIGTVMRLGEEKRPLLWAQIASLVRQAIPGAHFLIVGDGPLRSALEIRCRQPDLSGAVCLTGYEKDSLAAIASMDLFLLTSRAEGLPNVLLEAQALGVPVVTTDAGGASETIDRGRTGWVLESDDPASAAAVVVRLLSDREWRQNVSIRSREFVKRCFSMDRVIDELAGLYGLEFDYEQPTHASKEQ
jgi:glycosyltransferase involved in cell wall biosynthesis